MTQSAIQYFGGSVYDTIQRLKRAKGQYKELLTFAKKISLDLKHFDTIYSNNFLSIEEILNEDPTAWLGKEFEWQMVYRRLAIQVIKLTCLWGYELLPSSGNPDFYGKYFASLKTFEERMVKTTYSHPFSDIDNFEYTQLFASPLNSFDGIGPAIVEMIDILIQTDFTGDFSFMLGIVDNIIEELDRLIDLEKDLKTKFDYSLEDCAEYDDDSLYEEELERKQIKWEKEYYQPEKTLSYKKLTVNILKLTCAFSASFLPQYTYHSPEMFRAFFYCLNVFADQAVKIVYAHPRTDVDIQTINGLTQ